MNGISNWIRLMFGTTLFFWISLGIWSQIHPELAGAQLRQVKDERLQELHRIGKEVAEGILRKDTEVILRYDRPDMVKDDRSLLKDKKSDLYCYLFDSSCMTTKGRSVYEILRKSRELDIKVQDLGKGKDGFRYAILYFFDAAVVDRRKVTSPAYLCEKGGKEIVTWTFRYVKGRWESAHPPFDAETDVHCNPD